METVSNNKNVHDCVKLVMMMMSIFRVRIILIFMETGSDSYEFDGSVERVMIISVCRVRMIGLLLN